MRKTPLVVALLGVLSILVVGGGSFGYQLLNYFWPSEQATFRFNANFTDPSAGSTAEQLATLREAMNNWNGVSDFTFNDGGTTGIANTANDGINQVHYSSGMSSGSALAVTVTWFVGNTAMDANIRFFDEFGDGSNIVWGNPPNSSQYDMKGVGTHEFGHALGLEHSAQSGAIMFFASGIGPENSTPLLDDLLGVTARYGHPTLQVTGVNPNFVDAFVPGQIITITGSGFGVGDSRAFLRRKDQNPEDIYELTNVTVLNSTTLTGEIPALEPQNIWPIAVLVGADQADVSPPLLTYSTPPPPVVTSLNPASGPQVGGTLLTISGSNFTIAQDSCVDFDGAVANIISVTGTEIVVETTDGPIIGLVDVNVSTSGGSGSRTNGFEYTDNPPGFVQSGGNARLGGNLRLDVQGAPNRNIAVLADARAGSAIKGGIQLGLDCTNKFTVVHNSFSGGDATLDSLGRREVTLSIPNQPALLFRTFFMQSVVATASGIVPTQVLQFTVLP